MGIEGTHYTVENGEQKYTDMVLGYEGGGAPELHAATIGGQEIGYFAELGPEIAGMTGEAAEGFKEYADNKWTVKAFRLCPTRLKRNGRLQLGARALTTYMKESQQNWILGNKDVDASWDQYVSDLKSLGLDEVMDGVSGSV